MIVDKIGLVYTPIKQIISGYTEKRGEIAGAYKTTTGRIYAKHLKNYAVYTCYSDDNGETWVYLTDPDVYADAFEKFYVHPTSGRIFAYGKNCSGIFYTDDNYNTWTGLNDNYTLPTYSMCITPTGRIITGCASNHGIYYSDDNGETWVNSNDTQGSTWQSLYVTSTGRVFAGSNNNGVWYSDDNGETWVSKSIQTSEGNITNCKNIFTQSNKIFVLGSGSIYYSSDNGETWTHSSDINTGYLWTLPTGRWLVSISSGIYYSDDEGITWTLLYDYSAVNAQKLIIMPEGTVFIVDNSAARKLHIMELVAGVQKSYSSKPLTGKQAKELVQQCKAYVQSLKNGN